MTRKKEVDVVDETIKQEKPLHINEIGDPGPVEPASPNDIEMEAFMNDMLLIIVHESPLEGQLEVIAPQVNGVNQPIVRGKETRVKRKYVEALARSTVTNYRQTTPDASKPDNIQMIPRTSVTYPFSVLHDPHPKGREWLKQLTAQQ